MNSKTKKTLIFIPILVGATWLAFYFGTKNTPIMEGEVVYGIEYKDGLALDIYHPTEDLFDRSPVVMFIHGGGWVVGRKESINFNRFNGAINTLRERGYTILSIEYTLARKESPFPHCIVDAYDALNWLSKNAEAYNLNVDNVGLFGESAGAHIAMMVSYSQPEDFSLPYQVPKIRYVVDVYGPTDLNQLRNMQALDSVKVLLAQLPDQFQDHLNIERRLFGFDPEEDTSRAQVFTSRYSPISYLDTTIPSTLIIHGDADQLVPISQSQLLAAKLNAQDANVEFHVLEDVNHAFIGASRAQRDSVQIWISEFVQSVNSP